MRGIRGLVGQSMAGPLIVPTSLAAFELGGRSRFSRLALTGSPPSLDVVSTNPTISTPAVTVSPSGSKRGARHAAIWRQMSGLPGVANEPDALTTSFTHVAWTDGVYPVVWRCTVGNQFGRAAEIDVGFTVEKVAPAVVPINVSISPSHQLVTRVNGTGGGTSSVTSGLFTCNVDPGTVPPIGTWIFQWFGGAGADSAFSTSTTYTRTISDNQTLDEMITCLVSDSGDPGRGMGGANATMRWISAG